MNKTMAAFAAAAGPIWMFAVPVRAQQADSHVDDRLHLLVLTRQTCSKRMTQIPCGTAPESPAAELRCVGAVP